MLLPTPSFSALADGLAVHLLGMDGSLAQSHTNLTRERFRVAPPARVCYNGERRALLCPARQERDDLHSAVTIHRGPMAGRGLQSRHPGG